MSLPQSQKLHNMWVQGVVPRSVPIAGAEEDPEFVSWGVGVAWVGQSADCCMGRPNDFIFVEKRFIAQKLSGE
jgi:hypothetical protein